MAFPDLVEYTTEEEYREHYHRCYVNQNTIATVDGIPVRFFADVFDHAFYKSSDRKHSKKDTFAPERAKRIDWIRFAIEEGGRVEYFEWTDDQGCERRELLLGGSYLVVLQFRGKTRNWAKFITAFPHDNPDRIRHDPNKRRVWPKKNSDRWLRPSGPSHCRFQAVSREQLNRSSMLKEIKTADVVPC